MAPNSLLSYYKIAIFIQLIRTITVHLSARKTK